MLQFVGSGEARAQRALPIADTFDLKDTRAMTQAILRLALSICPAPAQTKQLQPSCSSLV